MDKEIENKIRSHFLSASLGAGIVLTVVVGTIIGPENFNGMAVIGTGGTGFIGGASLYHSLHGIFTAIITGGEANTRTGRHATGGVPQEPHP